MTVEELTMPYETAEGVLHADNSDYRAPPATLETQSVLL